MKIIETEPPYPLLSFRDLELWIPLLSARIRDARVQRIFVPEVPDHPQGFWKHTLVMELHSLSALQLLISLRPRECGIIPYPPRTFRPAARASKSVFLLTLAKELEGSRLVEISQIPGDRMARLQFRGRSRFELHLHLIPGRPLGVLLEDSNFLCATDSRTEYSLPEPRVLEPEKVSALPFHPGWFESEEEYPALWMQAEQVSLLRLRKSRMHHTLTSELHALESKRKSLLEQLRQTEQEPDWLRQGSLLQANLYLKPVIQDGFYEIEDPESGGIEKIPGDPKLSVERQLERCFHLAKRKKRRAAESSERLAEIHARIEKLSGLQLKVAECRSLPALLPLETSLGIRTGAPSIPSKEQKKISGFTGKQFLSREGLTILVGRNAAENLELTFKIARGNDLWLHVKGRPGAHAVVLLPPNRTASLETLLDAAHLCILYSGGKDWGKTEVDYTLRKNVKKIKNHTEVSYSAPKTLSVVVDAERFKRLGNS
jgi:predicted ribosome quality control (RQC) complex YloA/Tae2 family protein